MIDQTTSATGEGPVAGSLPGDTQTWCLSKANWEPMKIVDQALRKNTEGKGMHVIYSDLGGMRRLEL